MLHRKEVTDRCLIGEGDDGGVEFIGVYAFCVFSLFFLFIFFLGFDVGQLIGGWWEDSWAEALSVCGWGPQSKLMQFT